MADNFRFAQLQSFSLNGAGAIAGSTTIILNSMLDIDGNTLSMASDFGTIGFGTLEPGNGALEEQISFTGLTNNANGTTTLSGVSNVDFQYPYTQTSGLSKTHAGNVTFIISNTSGFYNSITAKDDDETIEGLWTFEQFPVKDGTLTPTAAAQFATKSYVDATATGTTNVDQVEIAGTAGETLVAGNAVYLKVADQRWWKANSTTTATSVGVQLGFATSGATAGNPVNILIAGYQKNLTGLSAGSDYFLTNTDGTISTTAGTQRVLVGNAISTTVLLLQFANSKAQGRGDNGVPSSANTFMTQSGFQAGTEIYAASSAGTDTYAITVSPAITAYVTGQVWRFKADVANTGAASLNVSGVGAITIKKLVSVDLVTGDILAGQTVEVMYDGTNFQMMSQTGQSVAISKFGGTGADGALSITSGTTTIDLASAVVVVKNYTSISITGTGALAFSNPAAAGSLIVLKSQGAVTITSSATRAIDIRSLGANGGAGGTVSNGAGGIGTNGAAFFVRTPAGTGAAATSGGVGSGGVAPLTALSQYGKAINLSTGSGGGGGGGGAGDVADTGGAGGKGAGGLYIECAGAYNFAGATIDLSGTAGSNGGSSPGTNPSGGGGGGGGGAGGTVIVFYTTLTADSGTYTSTGGTGGTGGTGNSGTGADGGGGGSSLITNGVDGNGNSSANGGAGGAGAVGTTLRAANTEFF